MAIFAQDTFTDTNSTAILSHIGENSLTWRRQTGSNDAGPIITSNTLVPTDSGTNGYYYCSATPASADYSVTYDLIFVSGANTLDGVGGRMSNSAQTGYYACFYKALSHISLFKHVAGSLTEIAFVSLAIAPTPDTWRITLDMVGTTISVQVQRLSDNQYLTSSDTWQSGAINCISTTDSSISAAGFPGMWISGAVTPNSIDNFLAEQAGAIDYSTTLDAGTYNITGQDVTMTYSPASGGTTYTVDLEAGTYTITGQGANSLYSVAIEAGSYAITGQDLTLTYTPTSGPAAYSIDLEAGTYSITGRSINLLWSGASSGGGGLSKKLSLSMSIGL